MRMEAGSVQIVSKYTGVGQALKLIVKEEGIQVMTAIQLPRLTREMLAQVALHS